MNIKDNMMIKGVMKLARDCAGVTKDDVVAVVCDYDSFEVAIKLQMPVLQLALPCSRGLLEQKAPPQHHH